MTPTPFTNTILTGRWTWRTGDFEHYMRSHWSGNPDTLTIIGAPPGRWWAMKLTTFGPIMPIAPATRLQMCPTLKAAQFANYYYHDYVARVLIGDDGQIIEVDQTWDDTA